MASPNVKFKLTNLKHKVFDDIKRTVTHNNLLSYPYFNKRFDIHTDASDYHLGSVIIYNGKPIAFYSRKRTETQN